MSKQSNVIDYGNYEWDIQRAMVDHCRRFPDKSQRPPHLLWKGKHVLTSHKMSVPLRGYIRGELIHCDEGIRQGFDIKVDDGWLELGDGQHVSCLRTWRNEHLQNVVEYPYYSGNGAIWVWNVYEMVYPNGNKAEEKWTGNAGFWIETRTPYEHVLHCSHGMAKTPDFELLIFKVTISEN